MTTLRKRLCLIREFEALLDVEQAQRAERSGRTNGEPDWAVMERDACLDRVNILRAEAEKGRIGIQEFDRLERNCQGHSDYTHKLALACALLVERE